jgi:hypothetical protein
MTDFLVYIDLNIDQMQAEVETLWIYYYMIVPFKNLMRGGAVIVSMLPLTYKQFSKKYLRHYIWLMSMLVINHGLWFTQNGLSPYSINILSSPDAWKNRRFLRKITNIYLHIVYIHELVRWRYSQFMPTAVNVFYWITKPRRRVVSGEDCSVDKIRNFFSLLVFEYTFKLY